MSRACQLLGVAVGFGVLAVVSSLGYGQQREEQRQEERRVEQDRPPDQDRNRQPEARRAKSVLGSKVSIRGDIAIGTVEDIIFADDGVIDYLVVLNEGKQILIPWEAAKFTFERNTVRATVDLPRERIREAPVVTQQQWATVYEPAYRKQLFGFYGLRPPAERRIIIRGP